MRELQILFSGAMVRGVLADSKTQTRRAMNERHRYHFIEASGDLGLCPCGEPGDRLYVRETFFAYGRWGTRFSAKKGRDEWHFIDMTVQCDRAYHYAADAPDVPVREHRGGIFPGWWKRPAIHMPRAASRIFLDVSGVRVERLQDISESDSLAEGVEQNAQGFHIDGGRHFHAASARESYASLWDSLKPPSGSNWADNPWVWVVDFKRSTASSRASDLVMTGEK